MIRKFRRRSTSAMASFRYRWFLLLMFTGTVAVVMLYYYSGGKEEAQDEADGFAYTTRIRVEATMMETTYPPRAESLRTGAVSLPHRLVHLDLKGAPPKVDYYVQLFPLLREMNATGILLEYEDMFPYWGALKSLAAGNAYSRHDVSRVLSLARDAGLMVVPLVQTFGHFEFALKLAEFAALREVPHSPQAICPSRNESFAFVAAVLDQMLTLHPGIEYLHVGCDEVYDLGECPQCRARDRDELFLSHVKKVASHVRAAGVRAVVWDDMFRGVPEDVIRRSGVAPLVDIVVWEYRPSLRQHLDPEIWPKYSRLFNGIWVASAFKGATGPRRLLPDVSYHLRNQRAWLEALEENSVAPRGIVLTGWQRYDHFAALCELLPAGLPSLALSLAFLQHGHLEGDIALKLQRVLGCSRPPVLPLLDLGHTLLFCNFPGAKIHLGVQQLTTLLKQKKMMEHDSHFIGWLTSYQRLQGYSSPSHVLEGTKNLTEILVTGRHLRQSLGDALAEVYDGSTVSEWMSTALLPVLTELEALQRDIELLLGRTTWPRRPWTPDEAQTARGP